MTRVLFKKRRALLPFVVLGMSSSLSISFDDVAAASKRVSSLAHKTPVLTSSYIDTLTGAHVMFKMENMQRIGAFKFRGAVNSLLQFSEEQRRAGIITFSRCVYGLLS